MLRMLLSTHSLVTSALSFFICLDLFLSLSLSHPPSLSLSHSHSVSICLLPPPNSQQHISKMRSITKHSTHGGDIMSI